ncbi:MAG: hypothetical protein IKZ47_07175, partial [Clostridia bacterium]|nr:hypothetical protein [Clostridia bacterium]
LVGKIAVLKDIDNHRRVIYGYDAETGEISERLATVAVIYAGDWDSDDYDRSGMFELARRGDAVFAGAVNPAAAGALTEEALAEMFKLTQ